MVQVGVPVAIARLEGLASSHGIYTVYELEKMALDASGGMVHVAWASFMATGISAI